ncbi:MAG TPA: fused MFS/spermidine synthase, partial [candidate division Zixibacteria bacterium]|nr:fused MFS/spermidine synthase [candidate division Zixibacteria bacterium]
MKKKTRTPSQLALLILVCFFLSGFTGLIYEVLWTRMIVKIIGGAPFAISIILTIFMGGLGLGSYLAGRVVDRVKQPEELVRLYGYLELMVGAYGLVLPGLMALFRPLFAAMYNGVFEYGMIYNLLTFAGCALLLILPVTFMGATLPVLSRFYVSRLGHLGTHTGRLYGLNTIGAGFGSLATGFWLIAWFGMWGTLATAVALNAAIGLTCVLVGGRARITRGRPAEAGATGPAEVAETPPRAVISGALVIFAVSGFCSMSYEVIWTKLLGLIVGPTTYSFTVVLVTFIIGLALGAMLFGWLADRTRKPAPL